MTDDKLVEAVARAVGECRSGHRKLMLEKGGLRMMQAMPEPTDAEYATAAIAAVRQHTQNDWK